MEIWKNKSLEKQKLGKMQFGKMEIWKNRNFGKWKFGNMILEKN